MQIDALKAKAAGNHTSGPGGGTGGSNGANAAANVDSGTGTGTGSAAGTSAGQGGASSQPPASSVAGSEGTLDALKKLQQQMDEVNALLAKIESQISSTKKK